MPTQTTEERNGRLRTTVKIILGERVSLCRCMKSREFPFCDGTHKEIEGNIAGPVSVEAVEVLEEKPGEQKEG
jgi:CDGSH-type Zn-finger protein